MFFYMDKRAKKLYESRTTKELMWGMALYTGSSVLGPLIIFGFIGYILDQYFSTQPVLLISGVLLAFIVTNVLVFGKLKNLNKEIEKEMEEKKQEGKNKNK